LFVLAAASIARHLYIRSPCGVKGLVKIYGGRQNNGTCPSHFCGGSSSVARKALQSLEHLKIVEKDQNGYDAVFVIRPTKSPTWKLPHVGAISRSPATSLKSYHISSTKFGHLILSEVVKSVATRCHIKAKMHQI